jgi:peptidyl-prolyl cis-trans isomerase SurA
MRFANIIVTIFAASLCMALIILFPAGNALAQTEQAIVALVNDEPVTSYDVRQRIRLITVTQRKQPSAAMRKKVIESLISERIQLQQATKNSVLVSDDQVNKVFGRVAQSNKLSAEQLTTSFAQLGVDANTMKEQIRARLSWREVVQRKFRGQVSINASQIDKAISSEEPAEGQKKSVEFQLQRVRLELPKTPNQRTIANRLIEAERLRNRIRSCNNLKDVTKRVRNASIKSIGRKSTDSLVQPTRAILLAAKEGQMTPPVITSSGIESYIVCAKRSVVKNDQQRRQVRSKLLSQEYDILARRHLRDLRQDAFVEYR